MDTYQIYTIEYEQREASTEDFFLRDVTHDKVMMSYYIWAIVGSSKTVIVDTGYTEEVVAFANNIHNLDGGSHVSGFRSALTRTMNNYARSNNLLKGTQSPSGEDFREGLTAVIAVKLPDPKFEAQTKVKLLNPEVETFLQQVMNEQFGNYFEEHPADAKRIVQKGLQAAQAREAARIAAMPLESVIVHDCRAARFTDHGPTRRGTPVLISDVLDGAEVLLAAGDIRHHYFSGYSNPSKDILPGIAAFETIERNHSLSLEPESTFGRHPWHPLPARRTNPLAEDMIEAFDRAIGELPREVHGKDRLLERNAKHITRV